MANQALNDKRAQAAYLTGRANKKISRLRTKADVEVAGTRYDPRTTRRNIARYTEKQLDAYIARVSSFTDRGTQFVGDLDRRPIPSGEWRDYKRGERAHRKHMDDRFNSIKDIKLPGAPGNPAAETIAQRRSKMTADRKLAGNPSVNDPFNPPARTPAGVKDRAALKKLTKDMKRKSERGWDDRELKRQIGEFSQMMKKVGDPELSKKIANLTTGQFFTLWNASNFATAVSTQYEQSQLMLRGKDQPYHEQLVRDAFSDAHRLVDWAAGLDPGFGRGTVRDRLFT